MTSKYSLGKSLVLLSFALLLPANDSQAHSGSANRAAWDACHDKAKSASCEYEGFHGELYIGTCQSMSAQLICVRNQPIKMPVQTQRWDMLEKLLSP